MSRPAAEESLTNFVAAIATRDADRVVACLSKDCEFVLPQHPARSFTGRDQARRNWQTIFEAVPELQVSLLSSSTENNRCWAEWEYRGTRLDAKPHLMRGVTIIEVDESSRLKTSRFYVDYVDTDETSISEHLAGLKGPDCG